MEGHPAWMASLSLRGAEGPINVFKYSMAQMIRATELLRTALRGVGNPERERLFHTNGCLYLHRAVSERERMILPAACPRSVASLPLRVIYTRGLPPIPSTDPCADPIRQVLNPARPDLWTPEECGECPSCEARKARRLEVEGRDGVAV